MANFDFRTLTFLKASEMPAPKAFGRVSSPRVGISENGQCRFSKALLTNPLWAGKGKLLIGWDAETRTMGIMPIGDKAPKGVADADLFMLKHGKKNPDVLYLSLAGVLKQIGYDYEASGNQSFDVEVGPKGEISLVIPTKLTPPIKSTRKKKTAGAAGGGIKAESGSPVAVNPVIDLVDEDPFA